MTPYRCIWCGSQPALQYLSPLYLESNVQLKVVFQAPLQALGGQREVSMHPSWALDPAPAIPFPVPVAHHCLSYGFAILVMPHFHHKYLHHSAPRSCPCPEDNAAAQETREELPSISSHLSISFPCRIHGGNFLQRYLGGKMSRLSIPALQRVWTLSEGEFWLGVTSGLPTWTSVYSPCVAGAEHSRWGMAPNPKDFIPLC